MQDKNIAISELKKLIEKCKGKSVETKFDKPSVVQQPNAQRIPKPLVLGKPTPFSDSLERKSFSKTESVPKNNKLEGMYRIDTRTTQTRAPQLPQTSRNTNPHISTSTGVIHKTNASRPPLKRTQMKDKVVPNNSQVKFKKTKVENHHRISSNSNKTKSVTACNDNLKSRTSNVNAVCATCGKSSRIKKAQELKTKTSANSNIKDSSSETKLWGRLLEIFQEDAKYEHVGKDTRSQGGKDDQDKQGKDLEILKSKKMSKDNDKGSRSKIT
ncbi:hypothetical protein Tco_1533648 [Tanacetum coccineum]